MSIGYAMSKTTTPPKVKQQEMCLQSQPTKNACHQITLDAFLSHVDALISTID